MKKSLSLILCTFVLFSIFGTAFVLAESDSGSSGSDDSEDDSSDDDSEIEIESESESQTEVNFEDDGRIKIEEQSEINGVKTKMRTEIRANGEIRQIIEQEREERIAELRVRLQQHNGTVDIDNVKVKISGLDDAQKEILVGRINAKTGLNLTVEDFQNGTAGEMLRAYLSNGNKANIRVMPDRAAEIAVSKLRARCEDNNCTVELKEVGVGNKTRAVYRIETEKEARTLFIFRSKMKVNAEIDPETGEVLSTHKPWWAFLANENDDAEVEVETEVESSVTVDSDAAGTVEAGSEDVLTANLSS